jgi:hypothetical protein
MMAYYLQNLIVIPILFLIIFYLILLHAQKTMKTIVLVG